MKDINLKSKQDQEETFNLITKTMKAKKITFLKLSELTGISRTTLYQNLNFKTKMLLDNYFKICNVLGIKN